jgi:hypothetical protein
MRKNLCLSFLLLALTGLAQAQTGSTNACTAIEVVAGQPFVWTNTFSIAVVVSPASITAGNTGGTAYWNQPPSFVIPANGSLTVQTPSATPLGTYNLTVTFAVGSANPCGGSPGPQTSGGGTVKVKGS